MQWLFFHTPLLYLTQSLWRDEAFSILVAQKPLWFIFTKLGFEPPFYYVLLHFWLKIFGTSELAARSLSLLGFTLATTLVVSWSEKLFKNHWLKYFLPVFFFLNPMLLYYAFEVRTYGWYIFFAVATMYTYLEKKWLLYTLAAIAGFFTHIYLLVFIIAQFTHWFFISKAKKALRVFLTIGLFVSVWLVKITFELPRLKNSWYFPVDFQLVKSVLGNLFLGYEGTPWYLWRPTSYLSLLILFFVGLAFRYKNYFKISLFFALNVILPLSTIIGLSFIKPVFVNRYLIPVSIAEVFLITLGIAAIRHKLLQILVAGFWLMFVSWFNIWFPIYHQKIPIRESLREINMMRRDSDIIMAASPLIFFETIYYSNDPDKVFLYNPYNIPFPWYVGGVIVSPKQMVRDFPPYPKRAFLVKEDGSYEVVFQI